MTGAAPTATTGRTAALYRMAMPPHLCPSWLKMRDLLRRRGFGVEDRLLRSREEQGAFKTRHHVGNTQQALIDGERIGGHDVLRRHFDLAVPDKDAMTYAPTFGIARALATALSCVMRGALAP